MDQTQYIFLDVKTVQRLIAEKEKHDKYRTDELSVAIFLLKFCEKIWKVECALGFPLKNSQAASIPLTSSSDLKEIKDILSAKIEEAHDVDVLVVKHTPANSKRTGQAFQIKRFGTHRKDLTTDALIQYIQGLSYAKTDTALVILLETGEPTKFTQIRDALDFEKFPFSALYLVGLYGETLKFIEVWPNLGKEELKWSSV